MCLALHYIILTVKIRTYSAENAPTCPPDIQSSSPLLDLTSHHGNPPSGNPTVCCECSQAPYVLHKVSRRAPFKALWCRDCGSLGSHLSVLDGSLNSRLLWVLLSGHRFSASFFLDERKRLQTPRCRLAKRASCPAFSSYLSLAFRSCSCRNFLQSSFSNVKLQIFSATLLPHLLCGP